MQENDKESTMVIKSPKQRLVVLLEEELFEEFKKIAIAENRTVGNLGATVIKEFLAKRNIK